MNDIGFSTDGAENMRSGEQAGYCKTPVPEKTRKLRYLIDSAQTGMTIRDFLMREPGFSSHQISRLKYQREGICIDGAKAYVNHVLREGELLEIGLTDRVIRRDTQGGRPAKIWLAPSPALDQYPLEILYEDEDLLIVNKPAGVVCHPSPGHYSDTLANQAVNYLGGTGTGMDVRVTGRLDRETSGIVTLAKNTEAAGMIQKQRDSGILRKTYLALAWGRFSEAEGVIDMPLRREYPGSHRMMAAEDGKSARTFYRVLDTARGVSPAQERDTSRSQGACEDLTLLACQIEHGRTHQIRVHMAYCGHPLVGDPLYGRGADNESDRSMGLHAWKLSMRQPFTGGAIEVEAPAPVWAESVCDDREAGK